MLGRAQASRGVSKVARQPPPQGKSSESTPRAVHSNGKATQQQAGVPALQKPAAAAARVEQSGARTARSRSGELPVKPSVLIQHAAETPPRSPAKPPPPAAAPPLASSLPRPAPRYVSFFCSYVASLLICSFCRQLTSLHKCRTPWQPVPAPAPQICVAAEEPTPATLPRPAPPASQLHHVVLPPASEEPVHPGGLAVLSHQQPAVVGKREVSGRAVPQHDSPAPTSGLNSAALPWQPMASKLPTCSGIDWSYPAVRSPLAELADRAPKLLLTRDPSTPGLKHPASLVSLLSPFLHESK